MHIQQTIFAGILSLARHVGQLPGVAKLMRFFPDNRVVHLSDARSGKAMRAIGLLVIAVFSQSVRERQHKGMLMRRIHVRYGPHTVSLDVNLLEYSQLNYYLGHVDVKLLKLIANGGQRFADVGGFIGLYSCFGAHYFAHVDTFEPHPDSRRALLGNIALNKLDNVHVHPVGVSDKEGVFHLHEAKTNQGGSSLETCDPGELIDVYKVEVKTFDTVMAPVEGRIELIKIDVEGHEERALRGSLQSIAKHRPKLFVEVCDRHRALQYLKMLPDGYNALDPASGLPVSSLDGRYAFTDVVYY